MEKTKHIAILAAGDFPASGEPFSALVDADYVVCCDSAYKDYFESGVDRREYVVVGDGDSLSAEIKESLGDRWIHVAEQDYNDLHKALSWAVSKFGIRNTKFVLLGATGKREDHTMGNISYLVTFAEEYPGIDIEMQTDFGRFVAMRGSRSFRSFPGQQVSIFTMEPDKAICGTNLKWPLESFYARRWWQATLNEALADSFELRSEGWLIVFQTFERKG